MAATMVPADSAALNVPRGLAFDASGNLYVADENNYVVRKITAKGGDHIQQHHHDGGRNSKAIGIRRSRRTGDKHASRSARFGRGR